MSLIETPVRIAQMKKDARGYPIPFTVLWKDGVPDFRVIDPQKWADALSAKRCGICGGFLGAHIAFVGGPLSIENRLFTDLPMHRDCAIYALKTCPFLAAPKFSYAKNHDEQFAVNAHVSINRPERFGLGMTKKFTVVSLQQGDMALHAAPFTSIEWFDVGTVAE